MPNSNTFSTLNSLVVELSKSKNKNDILLAGLKVADEVMHILGIPYDQLAQGEDELDKALPNSKFKNQKMEQWFEKHPYLGNARIALYHYNKGVYPIESMFYMLSDTPRKEKVSATTQLFINWEDSPLTMIPTYKVGVDFFLSPKTKSLLFVVSKKTNLRVMEFSNHLTNTQIEILNKIQNVALFDGIDHKTNTQIPLEPQRTIHTTLWNALELKEVNKKFYIGIADHFTLLCQHLSKNSPVGVSANEITERAKIFSSRLIGRLLFVWFLKKKGIINEAANYFDANNLNSTEYYDHVLKKLFFNTLNLPIESRPDDADRLTPYLNGGLFEPHNSDWYDKKIEFPEGWFVSLYKHLNEFNFTTDESSSEYEQIAIDPEMLGRVFENLLASIVPETSKAVSERSEKGAFYTPREIVNFMCKSSLKEYLKRSSSSEKNFDGIDKLIDLSDAAFLSQKSTGVTELWGVRSQNVRAELIDALNNLKILDPACGSGAFPIGMLQLLLKTYERLGAFYDTDIKKMRVIAPTEHNNIYLTKLFVIRNCLYGVDIEPMAVEIARLRAWLSLIIDDKKEVDPLPNLDFNFVCANTLVPLDKNGSYQMSLFDDLSFEERFEELRGKYFNTHDKSEKESLRQEFDELYKERNNDSSSERFRTLSTWNPFNSSKAAEFFDAKTMFNVSNFDLVIGNPPYINFNDIKKASNEIYAPLKYETFKRTGDMYCLFIEKGIKLLKEKAILTYITSNKWMRAGYGEALRGFLAKKNLLMLIDFGGTKVFDSATVDTDIILVANERNQGKTLACEIKIDPSKGETLENLSDYIKQNQLISNYKSSENWSILSDIELNIKNKIEKYGTPLREWNIQINRGVLTGLNEAFIISGELKDKLIKEDPKSAEIIRPILRGRDIERYGYNFADLWLINVHNGNKEKGIQPIDITQYPSIKKHLDQFYEKLSKRADKGDTPYNLRNCAYMDDFSKQKLIWTPVNSVYKFTIVNENYFFNNSIFMITGNDLYYLCGILNSDLYKKYFESQYTKGSYNYGSLDLIKNVPIIKLKLEDRKKIEFIVNELIENKSKQVDAEKKINQIISSYFSMI